MGIVDRLRLKLCSSETRLRYRNIANCNDIRYILTTSPDATDRRRDKGGSHARGAGGLPLPARSQGGAAAGCSSLVRSRARARVRVYRLIVTTRRLSP